MVNEIRGSEVQPSSIQILKIDPSLADLPKDIQLTVFSYLSISDIAKTSLTCRSFKALQKETLYSSQLKNKLNHDFKKYGDSLTYLSNLISKQSNETLQSAFQEFENRIKNGMRDLNTNFKANPLEYLKIKENRNSQFISLKYRSSFYQDFAYFMKSHQISLDDTAPYLLRLIQNHYPFEDEKAINEERIRAIFNKDNFSLKNDSFNESVFSLSKQISVSCKLTNLNGLLNFNDHLTILPVIKTQLINFDLKNILLPML